MAIWASIGDHFALHKTLRWARTHRPLAAVPAGTPVSRPMESGPAAGNGPAVFGRAARGGGMPPVLYTVLHYLVLTLGVVSKFALEAFDQRQALSWVTVISAAVLAAVVFPYVFRKVYDGGQANGMQYFLSFQNGFFVQTVLEEVRQAIV